MLNDKNSSTGESEANLYPLEWLFIGGDDPADASTEEAKIASIVDGYTSHYFMWSLHNSINSAIPSKTNCRFQETYDIAIDGHEGYHCGMWPWAKRYERAFGIPEDWALLRQSHQEYLLDYAELDNPDLRGTYWVEGNVPADWETRYEELQQTMKALFDELFASGVFTRQYFLTEASDIDLQKLDQYVQKHRHQMPQYKTRYDQYESSSKAHSLSDCMF